MFKVQKFPSPERPRALQPQESPHKQGAARSCLGCHRRKVRCDRGVPCTNCAKGGFTCVYPTKERDERIPSLQRIASRLERLENIISGLPPEHGAEPLDEPGTQVARRAEQSPPTRNSQGSWELLLNDGQAVHYVNNSNIKDLLQDEERIQAAPTASPKPGMPSTQPTPHSHATPAQQSPLLDNISDILEFYPEPQLALKLWAVYVESVDPVMKLLHIPTVQTSVISTILDPKAAGRSMVALTYAIYFAAVIALDQNGGENCAAHRLLIVTDLMNWPEMTALQALTIYVTCLRVNETGRSIWVLIGLAIRLAQAIGLHRDGASLRLSPFETEMRLRLWWHLCVLDARAPEDHGFEPTVNPWDGELRLPLNINDDQIYPRMTQLPAETRGWTEMSFSLLQTELLMLLRPAIGTQAHRSADVDADIRARKQLVDERSEALLRRYGDLARESNELCRLAFQHFTIGRYKMHFILQLREEISEQKRKGSHPGGRDGPNLSFKIACDVLQVYYNITKGHLASRYKWLFATYTQWYAVAYVLRCLCRHPDAPDAEHVWALVEGVFPHVLRHDQSGVNDGNGNSPIWGCLILLRKQALLLKESYASARGPDLAAQSSRGHQPSQLPGSGDPSQGLDVQSSQPVESVHYMQDMGHGPLPEPHQPIFSDLEFSMPEIPFLPEWDAVINGCLNNGNDTGIF
ncbi:hypothetical protein N7468_003405 [Penicillium chermesinum]|uniref:Zn(2)-C6 fungal-type domain-containing protein n=1 Tax=Penicillium chermesinum TaxID=63820 RepID=A0A9W9P6C8_9EURO|nr:uncharacterized protein N7468_003405 [Penicillium chermesinum]KAJ5238786.1 hypothetical protein N7468_003405 [Penicillium chermesinum]